MRQLIDYLPPVMAELLEMNPGLSSPTRLTLGQKVRVQ